MKEVQCTSVYTSMKATIATNIITSLLCFSVLAALVLHVAPGV